MIDVINSFSTPLTVLIWTGIVIATIIGAWAISRLNRFVFTKIGKRYDGLHLSFLRHICGIVLVVSFLVIVISSLSGARTVWETMLGGTALISAVMAFVAQDIIKDILAGLVISMHRPFEVGDRIVADDGTSGVVTEMSLRHVVLVGVDTVKHIIPNSKINAMTLSNFSIANGDRSVQFRYSVGYESDMDLVKSVIEKAVSESEYSIPALQDAEGNPRYGNAYFMSFADSALIVQITVYYEKKYKTEVIIDDINRRVRDALRENGIEIPYNYINVVTQADRNR